jgi:anti-sigma B factor antagonist
MDGAALRLNSTQHGTSVDITLAGELDLASVPVLRGALRDAISHGSSRLIVDADELSYIDSSGVHCLVEAAAEADAHGGQLVVRNANGIVMRVLTMTGVDAMLLEPQPDGAR